MCRGCCELPCERGVACAGVAVCSSDFAKRRFNKLRRPIYPLDLLARPSA